MQNEPSTGGGDDAVLRVYLQEVARNQPLSEEQEEALLGQGRAGDAKALRQVIESYLERAARIAITSAPPSVDRLQAIQLANGVLISLVESANVAAPGQVLDDAIRRLWVND